MGDNRNGRQAACTGVVYGKFNKGLATLLQYVDTVMVGQLGEQATASVSITTNVTWLVNSVSGP